MLKAITRFVFAAAAVFCLLCAAFWVWFGWQHGVQSMELDPSTRTGSGGFFVLAGFWFLLAVAFGVIHRRWRRTG